MNGLGGANPEGVVAEDSLAPDAPVAPVMLPLLTGGLFRADRYHFFPVLDSTNRYAALLAQEGAEEGSVVVADRQTEGRGRLGRSWSSPAGLNLYVSVVLRPAMRARDAAQLTLLAGVALAHAVAALSVDGRPALLQPELKWPNDLLLQGRKVAGVLTEMRTCTERNERIRHVIVGIGVNVNGAPETFPEALRDTAISLATVARSPLDRSLFLAGLLAQLDRWYGRFCQDGFAPLRAEWLACSRLVGQPVRIRLASENFSGQAMALDADGCLLVQRANGMLTRVVAGDVLLPGER
ncbi:MAG: biotin--[acetyl-CoA-carboxylase] ligase [Magnetococcus sp. MYC-9]